MEKELFLWYKVLVLMGCILLPEGVNIATGLAMLTAAAMQKEGCKLASMPE